MMDLTATEYLSSVFRAEAFFPPDLEGVYKLLLISLNLRMELFLLSFPGDDLGRLSLLRSNFSFDMIPSNPPPLLIHFFL